MIRPTPMWRLALALMAAPGAAMAAIGTQAAQELTHKSGLWVQLDSLGTQVREGMSDALEKNGAAVSTAQKTRMLDCAESSFGADGLRAIAVDAVAGAMRPVDVLPLQAWYDSPLGRRIAAAEEASAARTISPQERLRQGNEALAAASPERRAALQSILTETHSVEIMADTLIEMAFAVQQGMASLDPAVTPAAIADIKAQMASRRPQLIQHYAQISQPAYAFTYAGIADDDLAPYAEHLSSPPAEASTTAPRAAWPARWLRDRRSWGGASRTRARSPDDRGQAPSPAIRPRRPPPWSCAPAAPASWPPASRPRPPRPSSRRASCAPAASSPRRPAPAPRRPGSAARAPAPVRRRGPVPAPVRHFHARRAAPPAPRSCAPRRHGPRVRRGCRVAIPPSRGALGLDGLVGDVGVGVGRRLGRRVHRARGLRLARGVGEALGGVVVLVLVGVEQGRLRTFDDHRGLEVVAFRRRVAAAAAARAGAPAARLARLGLAGAMHHRQHLGRRRRGLGRALPPAPDSEPALRNTKALDFSSRPIFRKPRACISSSRPPKLRKP